MSDKEEDMKIIECHVNALAEHFDSVQVFVTRRNGENDTVMNANRGAGNWFTRYGQVRYWMEKQDEATRIEARNDEKD